MAAVLHGREEAVFADAGYTGADKRPNMPTARYPGTSRSSAALFNLGNFVRTLAMPKTVERWSMTSLREKLIKIGAEVVSHDRYVTFLMWTAPSSQGVLQF